MGSRSCREPRTPRRTSTGLRVQRVKSVTRKRSGFRVWGLGFGVSGLGP